MFSNVQQEGSERIAEVAAEAAAEAVGGGRDGPAAEAAHAAARSGLSALAAAGREELGGVSRQTEALRQLVEVPLKAWHVRTNASIVW